MSGVKAFTPPGALLKAGWDWLQSRRKAQSRPGRLRVAELVSLGDKRLVAVVELDGRQFLIGCGPASVTMLARLESREVLASAVAGSDPVSDISDRNSDFALGRGADGSLGHGLDLNSDFEEDFTQVFSDALHRKGVSA